ncbi:glycoside hydrolase family 3 protein [Zasmidium cellare ATCC 36951]|uniref:beta-glucosidase n=1 Tax=Zasmidium cellare ATCC 36951 TaxID=1080233 RepID=A0A6A6C7D8_ZASCE|nr:glycoside hydrolase family 3 protein [Zasmidium cellare ATCC 36951]KAF2162955.1 glycoside hydrolase family 3 protein [Zasmidium cellare ATCC 36951]
MSHNNDVESLTETPPFTFNDAVQSIRSGASVESATTRLQAQLTPQERLALLDGDIDFFTGIAAMMEHGYNVTPYTHGCIPRLAITGTRFTDGPRGCVMGASTALTVAMARGATWDTGLEEKVGRAIGLEARAQGANYFGGVCVNLPRHPAWGRIQETYGEEPLQLGSFGAALTKGVQENVMACVKHYALNSIENARFQVDVRIDEGVLRETYLAHFRQIVEAGVASVMASYNSVNDEWAGQNGHLLLEVLREEWGFEGFGWGALSVKNGVDIEAPFRNLRSRSIPQALEDGRLAWSDVDRAGKAILQTHLKFLASRNSPEPSMDVVFSLEHRRLAREVANRSIVLLKNEGNRPVLPLDQSKLESLAIVGRLADTPNTGDKGSSAVRSPEVSTPYQGFKAALPKTAMALDTSDEVEKAVEVASHADAAIVIVGYDYRDEGEYIMPSIESNPELVKLLPPPDDSPAARRALELRQLRESTKEKELGEGATGMGKGGDRESFRLRPRDVEIIQAVAKVNRKVIVCVIAAGAVLMDEWKNDVRAILIGWYSGCEGGHALADVVLGRTNVSGRLPFSIPSSEEYLPFFDRDAKSITYDEWHGQRLLDRLQVPAAFPLGYRMSYTMFRLHRASISGGATVETPVITAIVSNTGSRRGRYVIQVYGSCPAPSNPAPRVLIGFSTLDLEAKSEPTPARVELSLRGIQRWRNGAFLFPGPIASIEVGAYAGDPERAVLQHHVGDPMAKI